MVIWLSSARREQKKKKTTKSALKLFKAGLVFLDGNSGWEGKEQQVQTAAAGSERYESHSRNFRCGWRRSLSAALRSGCGWGSSGWLLTSSSRLSLISRLATSLLRHLLLLPVCIPALCFCECPALARCPGPPEHQPKRDCSFPGLMHNLSPSTGCSPARSYSR